MTGSIYSVAVQRTMESMERTSSKPIKKERSERLKANHRKYCKKYRETHKEELAAKAAKRKLDPAYKERERIRMREWRRTHPGYHRRFKKTKMAS